MGCWCGAWEAENQIQEAERKYSVASVTLSMEPIAVKMHRPLQNNIHMKQAAIAENLPEDTTTSLIKYRFCCVGEASTGAAWILFQFVPSLKCPLPEW